MNLNCEKIKLGFCDNVYESTAEQALEADISLPDYCPEIQKVLRCSVETNIISVQNNSGRVTAEAQAIVRLIYVGDNGKTAAYEQSYPVQKYIESEKITQDSSVSVFINTDYVNCRAVNQRRTDIKAMLTFVFKAVNKAEKTILCDAEGSGIQLLKDDCECMSLIGACEKTFSMSEVVELGSNKNSVSQIMNISCCAVKSDTKIINNKVLIKGDCNVKIYYLSEDSGAVDSFEHSMPLSQIVELNGINENSICSINFKVSSCEASVKADSSGNMRLIDLNIKINTSVYAFEQTVFSLINDAYSTDYISEIKSKNIELYEYNENFENTFVNKVVLESIGVSVDCVLAVWCSDIRHTNKLKNGKCITEGTYQANLIYKDSEGKTGIIQKPVDFLFETNLKKACEKIVCYSDATILASSCSVSGESRLDLKTELSLSALVLSAHNKKYVSEIEVSENVVNKEDNCALTIYFAKEGEKIWDIAKKYSTTSEAILIENDLADNKLIKNKTLMIPIVN